MPESVRYELRGGEAWITLAEPGRRNALSENMVSQLLAHVDAAIGNEAVRVLILTGEGPAFCAGADLKAGGMRRNGDDEPQPFARLLQKLWNCPKPVVGRINGHAFGGGLGLVAVCDLVVASRAANFSFSEVRIGVAPAMISVVVLRKMSVHDALWLFLTGERFDAERARDVGLVHRIAAAEELDDGVAAVLAMLRLGGPQALRAAKRLVRQVPALSMDAGFAFTTEMIGGLFDSEEAREGMTAFAEKRPPAWAAKED